MKAGKIFLWVAGIGTVAFAATYALSKPRAAVIWDTKSQTGSVTLGSQTVAYSPSMGSSTAKSWNGYQLSINNTTAGPTYTLVRHGNVIEQGNLAPTNTGTANVSINVT